MWLYTVPVLFRTTIGRGFGVAVLVPVLCSLYTVPVLSERQGGGQGVRLYTVTALVRTTIA